MSNTPIPSETEKLRSALEAAVATIKDYLAYTHDGDPWKEDSRAMGEMDINDYGRDGRLDYALSLLSEPIPVPQINVEGPNREAITRLQAALNAAHPNHKTICVYVDDLRRAIAALQSAADTPAPPKIRFVPAEGETLGEMRANFRKTDLFQAGDACLIWANQGDLFMPILPPSKVREE